MRLLTTVLASALVLGVLGAAGSAKADRYDWHHQDWRGAHYDWDHHHWDRRYYEPPAYYAPPTYGY